MNILQLICSDNFIAVNKTLIKELGIEPALLLGELASEAVYWNGQEKAEDGYFYSTIENVEEKTTLTAYQQRKALAVLQEKGIINVVSKKGSPPKRYIQIDEDAILKLFNIQKLKNFTFESKEILDSKVKKLYTKNKEVKKKEEKEYINIVTEMTGFCSPEFVTAVEGFIEMRRKIRKPLTERAVTLISKKAVELSNGDEESATQIFNQSTTNSWLGLYPLKKIQAGQPKNEFLQMLNEMEVANDEERDDTGFGFATFSLPKHTN